MNLNQLTKFIAPLQRRVMLMVGRAVIKALDDSGDLQQVQLQLNADEIRSDVHRLQEYGFTSRPKLGSEAAVIFLGGNRDHGIVIAVEDRRYRLKSLADGEVALYDDLGQKVHLKRAGIEISTPGNVTIDAGGDVQVTAGGDASVEATNATVEASASAQVTAPEITLEADTQITATTPLMAVSGVISCSGIAAGGASPEAGKAKVQGSIQATANVEDANGTMQEMRGTYNAHTHGALAGVGTTPTGQMN